jgi:3-isopropylmalate/(R)-2-methylmalate dehydratase small subunit
MKGFGGKALYLDRSDINTDEIIPAKYLTEISKEALAPHLFEDLRIEGSSPLPRSFRGIGTIVARANFGCGSSREHAPWALEENGIRLVVAESFARIFRQNMFNGGMLAVELPAREIERLFTERPATVTADLESMRIEAGERQIPFELSPFDRALVEAGGWLAFADGRY